MIQRRRSGRPTAIPALTGSDIEALQTDVMRFMSILGLCLMAVFALVQSMPRDETSIIWSEREREKLLQDIATQQQRARALQSDLQRLTAQIQSARARRQSTQQALSSTQRQLTLLVEHTQQARSDRDRLSAELAGLRRELSLSRQKLDAIQRAAQSKAGTLRELQRRLRAEQKNLHNITQSASELSAQAQAKTRAPVVDKAPSPLAVPTKQGFTLRFASAAALHRLVVAGTVSVYAMAGERAWRLSLRDGEPVFAAVARPGWFHEMAASTVPVEYVQSLKRSVRHGARHAVVWGVQLPPATTQGIRSLSRGLQGGAMVIAHDGVVRLERE